MMVTFLTASAISTAAMPERFPADTLIYVSWPGSTALGSAFRSTAVSKILAEPQMQPLREKLLPAIDAMIGRQLGDQEEQTYARVKELLHAVYRYPTAVALIRVDASSVIPLVDAAAIVEAGADSASLTASLEAIFAEAGLPTEMIQDIQVGRWPMRELAIMGPAMSLRWGVLDDCFVVSFGQKALKHLVPEYLAVPDEESEPASEGQAETAPPADAPHSTAQPAGKNLAENPLFAKAMEVTGGKPELPVIFVNLQQALRTVEAFQPMLASFGVPVLGEEGGVRKVLAEFGADQVRSFSMAWTPEAGGLQVTTFFHVPGAKSDYPPLAEADLKLIPAGASWASAGQMNLRHWYDVLLRTVQVISADKHADLMEVIAEAEQRMGMKIGEDLLGSFGDTWICFDDPANGSLLFTGMTIVADLEPGQRVEQALESLVAIIAEETNSTDEITLRHDQYRGVKITYMNFAGMPMPLAPAWAVHENRWIVALYPQMVRVTLDRMMDPQSETLLDNQDFRRGYKFMPQDATSIGYIDTVRGVRNLYSIGLPVAQALISAGQEEGLNLDVSVIPALPVITQHLFATVTTGKTTPDGYLFRSHGAIPASVSSLSQASFVVPLAMSVGVPAIANARHQARRTVSMSNLKQIGIAIHMYAVDHDGKLPPDLQTLVNEGILTAQALRSPLDDDPGEEGSYIYVGAGLDTDMGPMLPVAYEKPEIHGGYMTNVVFLDGHVEFTTMDRLEELLEEVKELTGPENERDGDGDRSGDDSSLQRQMEEEEREESGASARARQAARARRSSEGDQPVSSEARVVRALVSGSGPIAMAIDTFRLEMGRYPKDLSELIEKPADAQDARKWNGPYVKSAENLVDAWGHPLEYESPGQVNEATYDLWSVGPDGESGTDDDLTNY